MTFAFFVVEGFRLVNIKEESVRCILLIKRNANVIEVLVVYYLLR